MWDIVNCGDICNILLLKRVFFSDPTKESTLNEPATTGRIMDRVEVKLDITSDR
jgi:hypothetical protein